MTTETTTPRVWIGCLAAYTAGKLHGEWVDAAVDEDEIWEAQRRVLASSPEPGAEEHFIADHEGFGSYRVGEYESLTRVALYARLIEEKGEAFAEWLGNESRDGMDEGELEEAFDEQFAGEWESEEAYARYTVEELGLPGVGYVAPLDSGSLGAAGVFNERAGRAWSETLDQLDSYLDWDTITRDVLQDCWTAERGGKVCVFRSY